MADNFPPSGFDRATGTGGQLGTPTPPNAIKVKSRSPGFTFEEEATSPSIERAEQGTIVHAFKADQVTGTTLIQGIGRGTIQTDSNGDMYRVLSARYDQQPMGFSRFTTTSESLTFDSPPDEFSVEVMEFNPALFRHPKYLPVTNYNPINPATGFPADSTQSSGGQIVSAILNSASQSTVQAQASFQSFVNPGNVHDPVVLALARELLTKYQQGEETFYLPGYKITWSTYWFLPPLLSPGGYIQDPVSSGTLPYFFWADDGTPLGNNIFTYLAFFLAPQFYYNGLSWLRLSDSVQFQRTWFKLTSQWLGGPFGHWDTDIYNAI